MMPEIPPDVLKSMVPLRKAARLARTRYERVRGLVDAGHLAAFADGNSLRVRPGDIGPAMLKAARHVPAAQTKQARKPEAGRWNGTVAVPPNY